MTQSARLTREPTARRRTHRLLGLALILLAFALALPAASAALSRTAKPGAPTAKAPQGTIATATPTFTWSKAKGAAKYELRVYQGSVQVLKKSGLTGHSWKGTALPTNVAFTWKVRAVNARGAGAWSKGLAFTIIPIVPPSPAKAITAFSFQGLTPAVSGVVNETLHTIALTVPAGTNVSALVPTITITGASVSPASGVAQSFSTPVTYTVTAADASTQTYTVTVTVAAPVLAIGQPYGGGVVAYILQSGDPGYVAGQTHGLIAAVADQSAGIQWATEPYWSTSVPGTGTALGTGAANTDKIIAQNGAGSTYAAGLARAYSGGGFSDWYLPSRDELNKLYLNRVAIGGFETVYSGSWPYYWSSSEYEGNGGGVWIQLFVDGSQNSNYESFTFRVRAVRAF